ncbi:hypothetical protein JCM8202v2_001629 [Rhodotorula sphaerocarpa]
MDEDEREGVPDLVAVGLQEMMPLHLALAGLSGSTLDAHDQKLRQAIDSLYTAPSAGSAAENGAAGGKVRYSLVGRQAVGAIALLVYARDDTVAPQVKDVQINTVGCGVLGLVGNKGAVGIRVTLRPDGSSRADDGDDDARGDSSWTFVSAHFAAHQDEDEARSNDWRNVVRRLVLQDGSRETQLFDTGHLFFCGDLNYRISLTSPTRLDRKAVSDDVGQLARSPSDAPPSPRLLAQDQLRQEQQRGVTLHHLREGEITFPPTYKYKPGSRDELSSKRVPGWCDRVLYASAAGEEVDVASYTSVMDFTRSDHKPVSAHFVIPASSVPGRIAAAAPFGIDPAWRLKQLLGLVLDRLVGGVWTLIMLAGFNRDLRLGLVNISIVTLTLIYSRHRFF